MLTGELLVNDVLLGPGDYLYTPPGAQHTAIARTDARFFLVLPEPPQNLDVAATADPDAAL